MIKTRIKYWHSYFSLQHDGLLCQMLQTIGSLQSLFMLFAQLFPVNGKCLSLVHQGGAEVACMENRNSLIIKIF